MNYIGYFNDTNDNQYTVKITTDSTDTNYTEVVLGETPFTTESNSDEAYTPLNLTDGTISIIGSNNIFDIYNSEAQAVSCEVSKGVRNPLVVFSGYIEPNVYDNEYNTDCDEMQVSVMDGLSTLQYFKFTTAGAAPDIVTFKDLLVRAASKCGCYDYVYVTKSKLLAKDDTTDLLSTLCISESNFFDDDDDKTAWKWDKVLEEMMKYLGMTARSEGRAIYMEDQDYIYSQAKSAASVEYVRIKVSDSTVTSVSKVWSINNLKDVSYQDNSATISLDSTYNKAGVKVSLYKSESEIPTIFNDENLTNVTTTNHYWKDSILIDGTQYNSDDKNTYVLRYYDNSDYDKTDKGYASAPYAQIMRQSNYANEKNSTVGLSYTNYVVLYNGIWKNTQNQIILPTWINDTNGVFDYPIFKTKSDIMPKKLYSNLKDRETHILISGSINQYIGYFYNYNARSFPARPYLPLILCQQPDKIKVDIKSEFAILNMSVQVGEYWYRNQYDVINKKWIVFTDYKGDSVTSGWSKEKGYITITANNNSNENIEVYNNFIDINNTLSDGSKWENQGYAIPIFADLPLFGKIDVTFYPSPIGLIKKDNTYYNPFTIIQNLDISYEVAGAITDKDDDTDTLYENVINDNYINEQDADEWNVNSVTTKGISYSYTLLQYGTSYKYCETLYDKSLDKADLPEHLSIEKTVNQHKQPMKKLNITLSGNYNNNSVFHSDVIDADLMPLSITKDYRYNTSNLTLLEKWNLSK